MTHEATDNNHASPAEVLALYQSLAELRDAQKEVASNYSPDAVMSWTGDRLVKLRAGKDLDGDVDSVPKDVRDRYEESLVRYSMNKISDTSDNHQIVSTLRTAHGELEDLLFSDTADREKKNKLTVGGAAAAIGGVAVATLNTVTQNGIGETIIAFGVAGVAHQSKKYEPTRREIDSHVATGIESDEIQDKVVAEIDSVGFKPGTTVSPSSVRNDMRRWMNRNQTGKNHRLMNRDAGVASVSEKLAVVEELYGDLSAPDGNQTDMNTMRIRLAQRFLLIELDGHVEKHLKDTRLRRGFGRAGIYAGSLVAAGLLVLPHLNADEPPVKYDRQPVEIESEQPDFGGIDDSNDGLNP